MSLDLEDVRLSLARGFNFPAEHGGVPCLSDMLAFVDLGEYAPYWSAEAPAERAQREKGFDTCKAAIIKAIVEVAGDEKNIDTLWDDSDDAHPGGPFVSKMVQWIRSQQNLNETTRDDLIMCAALSLGNLVRRGELVPAIPTVSYPHFRCSTRGAFLGDDETTGLTRPGSRGNFDSQTRHQGDAWLVRALEAPCTVPGLSCGSWSSRRH